MVNRITSHTAFLYSLWCAHLNHILGEGSIHLVRLYCNHSLNKAQAVKEVNNIYNISDASGQI